MIIIQNNYEEIKKFNNKLVKRLLFGYYDFKKSDSRKKDALRWAYIIIGKTRKLCYINPITMEAFKIDDYSVTNIQHKNFTFDRWCKPMDL